MDKMGEKKMIKLHKSIFINAMHIDISPVMLLFEYTTVTISTHNEWTSDDDDNNGKSYVELCDCVGVCAFDTDIYSVRYYHPCANLNTRIF